MVTIWIILCLIVGFTNGQNKTCFSQEEFDNAYNDALRNYRNFSQRLNDSIENRGCGINATSPMFAHFASSYLTQEILEQDEFATVTNFALKALREGKSYNRTEFRACLSKVVTSKFCKPLRPNCTFAETSYYRTDGQCNNVNNLMLGAQQTPVIRLLEDTFVDDIDTPSSSRSNNAKIVSNKANEIRHDFNPNDRRPNFPSDFSVIYWQIMTHDFMMTKKAQITTSGGEAGFNCCKNEKCNDHETLIKTNPQCIPIPISQNDSCYGNRINCLHYSKSMHAFEQCKINLPSTPINFHTPFLDFEVLYNEKALKHIKENGGVFDVKNSTKMKEILIGYDERNGQLPGLFFFLIIFAEFHNFIDTQFKTIQPPVTDRTHEVRKATTAIYQKLMVDSLNSVIPESFESPVNCYDPNINPQVSIEFNIAMRVFHYFIRDNWRIYPESLFVRSNPLGGGLILMSDINMTEILDVWDFYTTKRCGLFHGLLDSSWNVGAVGPIMNCNYFAKSSEVKGIDLRAFDMNFGQSLGEPSYCDAIKFFKSNVNCNIAGIIQGFYGNNVANVPLTLGLDVEGDGVTETTTKILIDQFNRTICGDQFWYNHGVNELFKINNKSNNREYFTKTQRDFVNNFTLRDLLCSINNCPTRIQENAFFSPFAGNRKRFDCVNDNTERMFKTWFN